MHLNQIKIPKKQQFFKILMFLGSKIYSKNKKVFIPRYTRFQH